VGQLAVDRAARHGRARHPEGPRARQARCCARSASRAATRTWSGS
jgi:hypothetical protein